ncbi:sulfotransferase domain protein [Leptolyngbya sp. PCC 7375]|nr:sulfotransferase domain protein [Leptolyngbya sp. PCC 7375]
MKFSKISIIIGTQKGGTSSLFNYLSQHPQVSNSKMKETDFFLKDAKWCKGIDYYENLYAWDLNKHLTALEASPNYTRSLNNVRKVIQRMKTVDIRYKFIYILRDPVQKIESMRKQGIYQGWYAKQLARETPDSLPLNVIESVSYAAIVDAFTRNFSREQILLLKTDELKKEVISMTLKHKICPFLAIEPSFEFSLGKIHNSKNSYRTDTIWHYLREARYLNPIKNIFPDSIKNNARHVLAKPLMNQDQGKVPPLTDAQKDFIRATLKDDSHRLETEYSLDISNWDLN